MRENRMRIAVLAAAALAATTAFAGGPLYTFDYANKIPYVWHMENHPNGAVPYYTDLGALGRLSNSVANGLVDRAFAEWNNVPTSSILTANAGSFSALGLPDIVCPNAANCNANLVIGRYNGGGIDVIYDNDGKILQNYLGVFGAAGVTAIEYVTEDTNEILEAWTVLNGPNVQSSDPNGERFRGVMTHEFGHTLNLAHSQANGFVYNFADTPGAIGCPLPYSGSPNNSQIETMYPSINLSATGTALGMATVDRIDDIAAISDLYPAAGWPANYATIRGTVSSMLNIRGNGTGDTSQVTGVNVIARNVADPFNDFTSYFTGQVSKGQAGADGSFELHGLTAGAQYVLYLDNARNGAFSVPRLIVLPGPEEYYNGAAESGNGETDDRCAYTTVSAQAGGVVVADMIFNKVKGAPNFIPQPSTGTPTDVTPDGNTIVGSIGSNAFVWKLSDNSFTNIGGFADGGSPGISDDGSKIAFSNKVNGTIFPSVYENGVWTALPLRADAVAPCVGGGGPSWGSSYEISGDGQTVVGLAWGNGCRTQDVRGFVSKNGITRTLPKSPDSPLRANRANAVSFDGSLIAGWDDSFQGLRRGAFWTVDSDGTIGPANLIQPDPVAFAGEGLEVCRDGTSIVGLNSRPDSSPTALMPAYHYDLPGGLQTYPNLPGATRGAADCVSDDNQIVGGWSDVPTNPPFPGTTRIPTLYTSAMGWTNLNVFMNSQGVFAQDIAIANPTAMSADGKTIVGWANSVFGQVGWVLQIPKSVVCHANPGSPGTVHTIDVSFPGGIADHLAHGDTLGLCEDGGQ